MNSEIRIFQYSLLMLLILSGCSQGKDKVSDCIRSKQDFDSYVERSRLPIIEDVQSLCHGLNMGSDFSDLPSKLAVGELVSVTGNSLTFKGIQYNATMRFDLDEENISHYVVGRDYMLDMNNICREFFMMVDSRYPSPVLKTMVMPKEIECR